MLHFTHDANTLPNTLTGVLGTLLPDHALNAFRTLFPLGKVGAPSLHLLVARLL